MADYIMEPRWISVDEDLPDDNVDVIVHYTSVDGIGNISENISIARRIGSWCVAEGELGISYWDIEFMGIDNKVLHWMILPPIPKKKK